MADEKQAQPAEKPWNTSQPLEESPDVIAAMRDPAFAAYFKKFHAKDKK